MCRLDAKSHPVALITGASSGIGEATARCLAQEGYHLALGARRLDRLEAIAAELRETYSIQVFVGPLDTRDPNSVRSFVDSAVSALGGLQVLIANAGLARGLDKIWAIPQEDLTAMLRTNVEGVVHTIQATLPHIRKAGGGHILAIGSIAGHSVYEGGGVYCASKFALRALIQTLRLELCGEAIRVSCVDPGMVETEFSLVRLQDEARAKAVYQGMKPLLGQDVAECIRWILSLPDHVNIDELVVKPRDQASATKVHRQN